MIPKTFRLVSRTWRVRIVTAKQFQRHLDHHWNQDCEPEERLYAKGLKGLCDPGCARIFVNRDEHKDPDDLLHTFLHEMVHAVKFANGEENHDEGEVDRYGGYIAQILTTAK